ncbi:ribonuclease III [Desulfocapsa sulfexigens DSM 10523]|uniref:Ribonuclease 3 n=1 Tax=Desulfocapsa sulfexigens (strain DSM 10523 / SB164P1) TaxID=1167006 RepID=M1NA08_DESSD|nr:ribonuclease III [Desulfocapsa sulfexigens]AGF76689.1 ribonuclease III [Desulfocapsa sulfexigens DSM 10523]
MDIETLVQRNKDDLAVLEQCLGYRFTDLRLLQKALIHSSFAFEQAQIDKNNEILEFLGDAVLDLVIGHTLCKRFPEMREGELTRLRSSLVNETHLATMARNLKLGDFLCLGKGEDASNGRNKSSILSCAYEAVIGAILEDSDYPTVAVIVNKFFVPDMAGKKEELLMADAKSRLQEALQEKFNEAPSYRIDEEEGPSHQKIFTVSVLFREEALGSGTGSSKKEAEQRAAATTLDSLDDVIGKFSS